MNHDEKLKCLYISLEKSCADGSVEVVKNILANSEVDVEGEGQKGYPLRFAVSYNHLEVVKYLLESPDLKIHATKHINAALANACKEGHLPMVDYLVKKHNANIYAQESIAFKLACKHSRLDVVSFLVSSFDLKHITIQDFLKYHAAQPVLSIVASKYEKEIMELTLKKKQKTPSKVRKL